MFLLVGLVIPVNARAQAALALPLHAVLVLLAVSALPCNMETLRIIESGQWGLVGSDCWSDCWSQWPSSLSAYYEVHLSGSDKAGQ